LYVFFPASRYSVFKDQIYSPVLILHQLGVANLSTFFSPSSFLFALFAETRPIRGTSAATGEGLYSQSRAGQGDFFLFLHFFDSPVGEFAALVRLRPLIAL